MFDDAYSQIYLLLIITSNDHYKIENNNVKS